MVHQRHRAAGPLQVLITPSAVFIIGCFNLWKLNVWKIDRGPSAEHSQRRRTDPAVVCFKNEPFYSRLAPLWLPLSVHPQRRCFSFSPSTPRAAAATTWLFFPVSKKTQFRPIRCHHSHLCSDLFHSRHQPSILQICKNLHIYPVFAERGISFLWDITEGHMTKIAGFFAHSGKWSKLKKWRVNFFTFTDKLTGRGGVGTLLLQNIGKTNFAYCRSNRHRLCHGILSVFPIDITKSK